MQVRSQTTSVFAKVMTGVFFVIIIVGAGAIIAAQFLQNKQLRDTNTDLNSRLNSARSQLKDQSKQGENLRQQLIAAFAETPLQTQQRIFAEVSQIYKNIPKEQPTFAEVQKKEELNAQPFFVDVENADYIIIFSKAKFAIVYRPSEHKIINAGQVTIQ